MATLKKYYFGVQKGEMGRRLLLLGTLLGSPGEDNHKIENISFPMEQTLFRKSSLGNRDFLAWGPSGVPQESKIGVLGRANLGVPGRVKLGVPGRI